MKKKKLVIISHTAHQITSNNAIVGWGPTVAEINYISSFWDEVVHVACIEEYSENPSLVSYQNRNITFKPIPSFGGNSVIEKLSVFYLAPIIVYRILISLKRATHVQVRVPMGIGVYVLPLFLFIPRNFILWVKYANNWGHISNSSGYRFQRWFLSRNFLNCKVTINGFWPDQPKHCLSFENPCITLEQYQLGQTLSKQFEDKFKVVFAGRMDEAKGIDILIDVIKELPPQRFKEWIFIGEGPLKESLKSQLKQLKIVATFTGFLDQVMVHEYLKEADILVLPSKSEGFPKIVAEAWNYKVIPIVTPVGSLPHYLVNEVNGFISDKIHSENFKKSICELLNKSASELVNISLLGNSQAQKFTFEHYQNRLNLEVFN